MCAGCRGDARCDDDHDLVARTVACEVVWNGKRLGRHGVTHALIVHNHLARTLRKHRLVLFASLVPTLSPFEAIDAGAATESSGALARVYRAPVVSWRCFVTMCYLQIYSLTIPIKLSYRSSKESETGARQIQARWPSAEARALIGPTVSNESIASRPASPPPDEPSSQRRAAKRAWIGPSPRLGTIMLKEPPTEFGGGGLGVGGFESTRGESERCGAGEEKEGHKLYM